jgi:hypothetical protein
MGEFLENDELKSIEIVFSNILFWIKSRIDVLYSYLVSSLLPV